MKNWVRRTFDDTRRDIGSSVELEGILNGISKQFSIEIGSGSKAYEIEEEKQARINPDTDIGDKFMKDIVDNYKYGSKKDLGINNIRVGKEEIGSHRWNLETTC